MHVPELVPRTPRTTAWPIAPRAGDPGRRTTPDPRSALPTAVAAATLAALVFAACHTALIDDSYITLAFARGLALHGHWGLISSRVSNTATSPLNVLVLAVVTLLVRDPVLAVGVVQVAAAAGTAVLLERTLAARGLPRRPALVAVVLTLLNPFVVSSTGLESAVAVVAIAALLAAAVTARAATFGAVAALLTLTRGDLAVLPLVVALGTRALWPGWRRLLAAAVALLLPWLLWSWLFLGSALPDTLLIKMGLGGWPKLGRDWYFSDGLVLYLRMYPVAATISLLSVAVGLLTLAAFGIARLRRHLHITGDPLRRLLPKARRASPLSPFALLALAGVVHWAVYSLLGVAPYHWYYAPLIATLGLWTAATIAHLWDRRPLASIALATALTMPILVFLASLGPTWPVMPITTNWGQPGQYRAVGEAVGRTAGTAGVATPGEVGTIAYYCDCQISDSFSDRALVMPMIQQAREAGGVAGWLWRLNYANAPRHLAPIPTPYQMSTSASPTGHAMAWPVFSPWNPGVLSYITLDGPAR
ncbi:hypothetical protein ABH935_005832 [Catenulispora sp. GAS73]|uniref:hypothetical protein n=1 Tax=Catenulispora sp. GAS73 TaxID=3156269 RepID=UPI003513E02B